MIEIMFPLHYYRGNPISYVSFPIFGHRDRRGRLFFVHHTGDAIAHRVRKQKDTGNKQSQEFFFRSLPAGCDVL
jgi:hypothetical protein